MQKLTHEHSFEWIDEKEGIAQWHCRCGEILFQYEDCGGGR